MGTLVAKRLLGLVPFLFVVSFAVFMISSLVPGDPAATLAGGTSATRERIEEIRTELHLDDPTLTQYKRWLTGAVHFDLGRSLSTKESVAHEIKSRLPITLSLALGAIVVTVLIGVPAGVISGMRPGSLRDRGAVLGASTLQAVPQFLAAALLVSWFAVKRRWFPALGFTRITESPAQWLKACVLPCVALGLAPAATLARQLRGALIDVLGSAYVRTAWAKGASPLRVVGKHALKNASIPAVTVIGSLLNALLGGSLIVEILFAIPGVGSYLFQGVTQKDLPVIQGVALTFVLIQVFLNLAVDLTYGYLNPKVRVT